MLTIGAGFTSVMRLVLNGILPSSGQAKPLRKDPVKPACCLERRLRQRRRRPPDRLPS